MKPSWSYTVDGPDLLVADIVATCFGGAYDRGDDGQTESGVMNDGRNPQLLGCALPIRSVEAATEISPLAFKGAHLPWGTLVRVWRKADGEQTAITVRLIDNGPDELTCPTHALDLTEAAAAHFAPQMRRDKLANDWEQSGMCYRILNGTRWIS